MIYSHQAKARSLGVPSVGWRRTLSQQIGPAFHISSERQSSSICWESESEGSPRLRLPAWPEFTEPPSHPAGVGPVPAPACLVLYLPATQVYGSRQHKRLGRLVKYRQPWWKITDSTDLLCPSSQPSSWLKKILMPVGSFVFWERLCKMMAWKAWDTSMRHQNEH